MDNDIRKRLRWVQLFEELKNHTQVCLKCGISRPTLRKWVGRYQERRAGRSDEQSRRPDKSPAARISERERQWITELRARGLGSRRIQSELKRSHDFDVSRPTIEKVLKTVDPQTAARRPPCVRASNDMRKRFPAKGSRWIPARSHRAVSVHGG